MTRIHRCRGHGPNSGKTAVTLGLLSYNPVTQPV